MFKIQKKLLVTIPFIMITLITIISIFWGVYATIYLKKDKINDFNYSTISKSEVAIKFLRSIDKDLFSLINNIFLLNLIDAIANEDTEQINHSKFEVETLFKTFSESRKIYDQIRYIDSTGQEIVRIDLEGKDFYIVPQEELQDKSHRYYFEETIRLNEGNIYISELDLNREVGEIEIPHKPMLRYAMPIFDKKRQNRGILILNVLMGYFLEDILMQRNLAGIESYLLDKEGFYLLHPEVSKQWGGPSDLNTGENLRNTFPQETTTLIISGQSGMELANNQFFNFTPIHFDHLNKERYWVLMEGLRKSTIYSPIYTIITVLGVLVLVLITVVIIFSYGFSKRLIKPLKELIKGTKQIANGDLEHTMTIDRRHNEILELSESFNLMVNRLRESNKKNDQLLLQIKKSSRSELERVNEELKDEIMERKHIEKELEEERINLEITVKMRTRELQGALQETREANFLLVEANKAKSKFLSTMSHELRTPLNAILGFADMLQQQFFGKLNEDQLEFVKQINESSKHLLFLINELLDVAKIDAGAMELELNKISPEEFINTTVSMMSSQFKKKNISVNTSLDKDMPIIEADFQRCKQIMFNLLSNAMKYTLEGGRIEIRGTKEGDSEIRVEVSDTGIGIKADEIEKVFSEFHQADRVRDKQLGGTGIGLALTRRLVELHGGEISAESEVDRGSTFWFTLPLKRQ